MQKHSHGPIVLGDSSTIVTESDSEYLKDMVVDFNPHIPSPTEIADSIRKAEAQEEQKKALPPMDTTQQPAHPADSVAKKETPAAPAMTGKGLKVPFKQVTVFIPGIDTRTFTQQDPANSNGASYQLVNGDIIGNELHISGNDNSTITSVAQHYQTVVIARSSIGVMMIKLMGNTSDWRELKGSNGVYKITRLDDKHLEYPRHYSYAQVRKAIEYACREHRLSRARTRQWLDLVRHVRSPNQDPFSVELRSVIWKIQGKDANGKWFTKQLRLDMQH